MRNSVLLKKLKKQIYKKGRFILSSGKISNYYLDKYLFETDPILLKEISKKVSVLMPKGKTLAVIELGGVALGAAISLEKKNYFVIIRKSGKTYGTKKQIEGSCKNVKDVIIVEDIITTGKSILEAEKILKKSGIKIFSALAVIFRGDAKTKTMLQKKFRFKYLFTAKQIINA